MRMLELVAELSAAGRLAGRSPLVILAESVRLRFGRSKLGISEYFDYGLYRRDMPFGEKTRFVGYRLQQVLEEILVDDYSRILSLDKLTYYQLMSGNGLPVPRTLAIFSPSGRHFGGPVVRTNADLASWLARTDAYPLYLKPSFGVHGRGNITLLGVDKEQARLVDGRRVPLDRLAASLDDRGGFGWLIQEALRPHPKIARLCGERISSVRAQIFLTKDGPRVLIGVWKINSGRQDSDNFLRGGVGNLVADVDVTDGHIARVTSGIGLRQELLERHPVTGERLLGVVLPDWGDLVGLLKQASLLFPGFLYQAWDVALTDRGPVPLEANFFGDVDLPQFASGRGLFSEELELCLRERGLDGLVSGGSGSGRRNRNGRTGRRRAHWAY